MSQSKEMARIAYHALSDKKGEDIKIIDITGVSVSYTHLDVYKRQHICYTTTVCRTARFLKFCRNADTTAGE